MSSTMATGDARQRRGKRAATGASSDPASSPPASQPATSAAAASSSASARNDKTIREAMARVAMANDRCQQLHDMWRGSLLKLAYLVVLLSLHQANGPARECIGDIKALNGAIADSVGDGGGDDAAMIGGFEAFRLVLTDSLTGFLGIVLAVLLVKFLSLDNPVGDFTAPLYIASAAMVPMCVSLYFQQEGGANTEEGSSCVSGHDYASLIAGAFNDAGRTKRQIPVPVVYHAIVTVSYWFMQRGKDQCRRNLEIVDGLMRQLDEARAKNEQLTKKKGGSTKKSKS